MKHSWKVLVVFLMLTQFTLLVSCSYADITKKEVASKIELMNRPRGTYYGMVLLGQIGMAFNNDTVEISEGVDYTHTIAAGGTKTYKINWQEYDHMYSTSKDINCVPLTEISTGKIQCFWFEYFKDNDFILYGFMDFNNKLQTVELHKEN